MRASSGPTGVDQSGIHVRAAQAGEFEMYFENRSRVFDDVVPSFIFTGIGLIALWGCSMAILIARQEGPRVLLLVPIILAVALMCFYLSWTNLLDVKIELSASPREARCWRKNFLTRLSRERCYRIPDDARVIFGDRVGGWNGRPVFWPIRITGIPRYYDFFLLGRCRTYDHGFALACKLSSFLGIGLYNRKGTMYPTHDSASSKWHGPPPDDDGPRRKQRHRGRKA